MKIFDLNIDSEKDRWINNERFALILVFVIGIAARIWWLHAVAPSGDSLKYWKWAGLLGTDEIARFSHAKHWTISYPIILWLLSFGQTFSLMTTAMIQATIQAALVFPMAQILRLLRFRHVAVIVGALAVAISPYTAFAGSRPQADPLATLLWWAGLVQIITLVKFSSFTGFRWWLKFALAASTIGLAAHLRLNMIPAIGISCICVLIYAFYNFKRLKPTACMAGILLLACMPALLYIGTLKSDLEKYIANHAMFRVWTSTHYLGYDRWNPAISSIPWEGKDPRPYLPSGWIKRADGPAVNALIDKALNGEDPNSVAVAVAELGRSWRTEHPLEFHIILPIVRVIGSWVPLSPEVWVRATAYRIGVFVERLITLIGLVVLAVILFNGENKPRSTIAAVIWISAFLLPTLTILEVHAYGQEASDPRVHHAGWVPMLAIGAAWLTDAGQRIEERIFKAR